MSVGADVGLFLMARWMIAAIVLGFTLAVPGTIVHAAPPCKGDCACKGDCDGDGQVTVEDLIKLVNIDLGNESVDACPGLNYQGCVGFVYCGPLAQRGYFNAFYGCPQ